jgi:hypothetical protein
MLLLLLLLRTVQARSPSFVGHDAACDAFL